MAEDAIVVLVIILSAVEIQDLISTAFKSTRSYKHQYHTLDSGFSNTMVYQMAEPKIHVGFT